MPTRTVNFTVTFESPFLIGDIDQHFPAGSYDVEMDEEQLEGVSFIAYRQTSARISLHTKHGERETLIVDASLLNAALKQDRDRN